MTLDPYSHWMLSMGRATVSAMDEALKGDEVPTDVASGYAATSALGLLLYFACSRW
jgi:hypothetical protein